MDYSDLNVGSWSSYLTRFKNLVRPDGISSIGEPDEAVEAARGEDSAKMALSAISGRLPNLVFEGYGDWYSYDDEWVLRNLAQVLTSEEEDEIIRRLDAGTAESLGELLEYISGQRLAVWETVAREEFASADGDGPGEGLTGLANTANWEASRTPGTYYYTYVDGRYLYSDLAEAPVGEWETLREREELATANAQAWGDTGWFCTPTGEPSLYGGSYVFAPDSDGPWMTEDQATAQLAAQRPPEPELHSRYDQVEPVPGYEGWLRGYDPGERAWKYARVDGGVVPDDEEWAAVNDFRANDTEYFAGPGYSATGWLPYVAPAEEQELAADPAKDAAAATVRQEVVAPGIEQLKQAYPGLSDAEAERIIVAATSQALQTN